MVTIQTLRPSKPKILAIWPLTELVDSTLSSITLFPKADRHLSFLTTPKLPSICHRCRVLRSFLPGGQQSELRLCTSNSLVLLTSKTLPKTHKLLRYPKSHPTGQPASAFCTAVNYTSTYACGHNGNSMTQNPRTGVEIPPVKALPKT